MTLDAPWSDGNGDEIERGAGDDLSPNMDDHRIYDTPPVDAQPVEPLTAAELDEIRRDFGTSTGDAYWAVAIRRLLATIDAVRGVTFWQAWNLGHKAGLSHAADTPPVDAQPVEPLTTKRALRTDLIGWLWVCHEFARTIRRWQHQPGVNFGNEAMHIEEAAAAALLRLGCKIGPPVEIMRPEHFAALNAAPVVDKPPHSALDDTLRARQVRYAARRANAEPKDAEL